MNISTNQRIEKTLVLCDVSFHYFYLDILYMIGYKLKLLLCLKII